MSEELQEQLIKRFTNRFSKYNEKVLYELGQVIKQIGDVIPSDAYKLAQQLKYNTTIKDLEKELAKITGKSIKEVKIILEHIAEENISFAIPYYQARNLNVPIYEHHKELQRIVNSMVSLSSENLINISKNTGFKLLDINKKPLLLNLEETYQKVIDETVYAVTTGKDSYNQVTKNLLKQLASSGVRNIEYESGYSRRIDTAVRMNVLDSMRQVSNETSQQLGKEFGSDGIEISVHINPAPDHEIVQGHQFSDEDFKKFQSHLDCYDYKGNFISYKYDKHDRRAISEYNCYHYIFPIILGVSNPMYSDEQLHKIINNNHKGVEINGKHYTNYEVTQLQRNIETEIRKAKEQNIIASASGNQELMLSSQERITHLKNKYVQISKQINSTIDVDKIYVPGYKTSKSNITKFEDITVEWLDKANPNSHKVLNRNYFEQNNIKYKVDGKNVVLDYSKNEKEIAGWLEKTFGGEIYMLPRVNNPKNIETPDYLFRKEYWDLKEITGNGKHTLDSAIKKKKNQSQNFIFDIGSSEMNIMEAEKQINKIMSSKDRQWVKKIIVKNNEIVKVYKKRD